MFLWFFSEKKRLDAIGSPRLHYSGWFSSQRKSRKFDLRICNSWRLSSSLNHCFTTAKSQMSREEFDLHIVGFDTRKTEWHKQLMPFGLRTHQIWINRIIFQSNFQEPWNMPNLAPEGNERDINVISPSRWPMSVFGHRCFNWIRIMGNDFLGPRFAVQKSAQFVLFHNRNRFMDG